MQCCARCNRKVFCTERKLAFDRIWHTFCFSCYSCRKLLQSCAVKQFKGEIFCECCFKSICGNCKAKDLPSKPPRPICPCDIPCKPRDPCKPCNPCNNPCIKFRDTCKSSKPCKPSKSLQRFASPCCLIPKGSPKVCDMDDCPPCKPKCRPCSGCCSPKKCRPSCVSAPPVSCCPAPVPRETANYYSRNHGRSPDLSCKSIPCCPENVECCKVQKCCPKESDPCTVIECCPPPKCCPKKSNPCCCTPKPCCKMECCNLRCPPPKCPPEPCCPTYCLAPPKRRIYYPPIKCCEPCPPEIICLEPPKICPRSKCCCRIISQPCEPCYDCKVRKTCCNIDLCCQRCGKKVFAAEKIAASGGVFHTCCFTCYCCCKQLEICNVFEACGEIYCKSCYRKLFGLESYGV